jgi:RNA polymerase sigma-70 factor (ECF subfamily)
MAPFLTATGRACAVPEPAGSAERRADLADFQRFYVEHVDLVRSVVARLLGPHAGVDDAIQEVFLVAFRKRSSFAGQARASTWLYSIAQRVAMSTRRRARVRSWLGFDAAPEPADLATPQTIFERREAAEQLYLLLDQLADKKRTVWILYELEGLPGEAIAQVIGCPVSTVWTRLYHARRELEELARGLDERSRP